MSELADDDLVALPFDGYVASSAEVATGKSLDDDDDDSLKLRLCVVRDRQLVAPLIRREDDVETDLFLDPRHSDKRIKLSDVVDYWSGAQRTAGDDATTEAMAEEASATIEVPHYGVGWYGQRPVPSLGGGPGYGAEADEVWSVEEEVLESDVVADGVEVPVIDVGMAHGEKARGGALF